MTEAPSPALVGGGAEGRAAPRFWASGRRRARWRGTGVCALSDPLPVPGWSAGRGRGRSPGTGLELELQAVPARQPGRLGPCPSPGSSRRACPGLSLPTSLERQAPLGEEGSVLLRQSRPTEAPLSAPAQAGPHVFPGSPVLCAPAPPPPPGLLCAAPALSGPLPWSLL